MHGLAPCTIRQHEAAQVDQANGDRQDDAGLVGGMGLPPLCYRIRCGATPLCASGIAVPEARTDCM